jgi:hypothetical protein
MRHIRALIIVAGCLVAGSAQSAKVTLLGPGAANSCGTWTHERQVGSTKSLLMGVWVLGFLSGANVTGPQNNDLLAATDYAGIYGWIDNYCKAHPLKEFMAAVDALVDELQQHNVSQR